MYALLARSQDYKCALSHEIIITTVYVLLAGPRPAHVVAPSWFVIDQQLFRPPGRSSPL